MPLAKKIEDTLNILLSKGYFSKKSEIINIALFEYFASRGIFDIVNKEEVKDIQGTQN